MSLHPTIYVIIPVYNAENYVTQAIESVLAQPYDRTEIICVDDGSQDSSLPVLKQYAAKYPNIHVIHQENSGVSAARNTGIEYVLSHCTNQDFITFLDSDDLWAKDVISKQVVSDFSAMDLVGYASVRCTNDLSRVSPHLPPSTQILTGGNQSLWCHKGHHMGAMFYSCGMLCRYGIRFINGLKYAEDGLFKFTCLFLAERIKLIDKVLYCYRMNSTSAMHSRKFGTDYMPDIIRGYMKTWDFLHPYENSTRGCADFCKTLAGIYAIEMISEHYQHFRRDKALQSFLKQHPAIVDTINNLDRNDLSDNHKRMYDLYMHSLEQFRYRSYLTGIKMLAFNVLRTNKLVAKIIEKKEYSLPNVYI